MAETRRNGNTSPAYVKIQQAVRKRIDSDQLKPGDPVSSERELAREHGVSLMTARHALAILEREGIVERRRGAGTFVAPPRIHFNKLMSYTEQMGSRGLAPRSKIILNKIIDDEPEVTARLGLSASSRLVKIERVRYAGEEPFALETCYLSASDFSRLTEAPLARTSLFATIENDFGVEIAYSDEEVDATIAEGRSAQLLNMAKSDAVMRIRQVIYSSTNKPIIYVIGLYKSERHTLFIRRMR
ncbi:MAG TPA: GntR family transcriptional regulator [Terriglobales bacterium]|jgi:GntR family transcriptional regulator|nr:GntR family transcriptional regulator [Terriglobales bacterium]